MSCTTQYASDVVERSQDASRVARSSVSAKTRASARLALFIQHSRGPHLINAAFAATTSASPHHAPRALKHCQADLESIQASSLHRIRLSRLPFVNVTCKIRGSVAAPCLLSCLPPQHMISSARAVASSSRRVWSRHWAVVVPAVF